MTDPNFSYRVRALLAARGIVDAHPVFDYIVVSDSAGERIHSWNEGRLGPRPSEKELASITDADAFASVKVQAAKEQMRSPVVQAMLGAFAPALGTTKEQALVALQDQLIGVADGVGLQ